MKYSVETLPRMDADIKKKAGLYTNNTFKGENNFEKVPKVNGIELPTNDLNGTNYLMVYGTGTPTENANELQAAYNEAKNMPRYLGSFENYISNITGILAIGSTFEHYDSNEPSLKTYFKVTVATSVTLGNEIPSNDIEWYILSSEAEAKSVRSTVIVAPGDYRGATPFVPNASGINIISLTGEPDVILNATIDSVDGVTLKGIKLASGTFPTPINGGKIYNCIDGNGALINYPAIESSVNYKVYTGIFNQSGDTAPTVNVLENTIGNIIWSRSAIGMFIGTLNNAFQLNKTYSPQHNIHIQNGLVGEALMTISRLNDNEIFIRTTINDESVDEAIEEQFIEIRVYN